MNIWATVPLTNQKNVGFPHSQKKKFFLSKAELLEIDPVRLQVRIRSPVGIACYKVFSYPYVRSMFGMISGWIYVWKVDLGHFLEVRYVPKAPWCWNVYQDLLFHNAPFFVGEYTLHGAYCGCFEAFWTWFGMMKPFDIIWSSFLMGETNNQIKKLGLPHWSCGY